MDWQQERTALRYALWQLAGTIRAVAEDRDCSEEIRLMVCDENSPLVDGAREAIAQFGLSNETCPEPPPAEAPR